MSHQTRVPDRILVKDLLLRGVIGLNDWEREVRQDILINLVMDTDTRAAAAGDDEAEIVNYRTVAKEIIAHVESARPKLVETLAEDLARICLRHGAERVRVRVEKPGALRFASSVGVEIERRPEDLAAAEDGA